MGAADLGRLQAWESCLLGMVAGCMSKILNYPLTVMKNTKQQGLPLSSLRSVAIVYRGVATAMVSLGATMDVQFAAVGFFRKALGGNEMASAFLGGFASGFPCSIWELVMTQQQRFGGSLVGTPARIVRETGFFGLFRGIPMCVGRESLFALGCLGVTPTLQRSLVLHCDFDQTTALATGALTGAILSATLTHPMDTIKTCVQGDLHGRRYVDTLQAGRRLITDASSLAGVFRGLQWRIAMIATTAFMTNAVKDKLAPLMFPAACQ